MTARADSLTVTGVALWVGWMAACLWGMRWSARAWRGLA